MLENCSKVFFASNNVILYTTSLKCDYGAIFCKNFNSEKCAYVVDFPELNRLLPLLVTHLNNFKHMEYL